MTPAAWRIQELLLAPIDPRPISVRNDPLSRRVPTRAEWIAAIYGQELILEWRLQEVARQRATLAHRLRGW